MRYYSTNGQCIYLGEIIVLRQLMKAHTGLDFTIIFNFYLKDFRANFLHISDKLIRNVKNRIYSLSINLHKHLVVFK